MKFLPVNDEELDLTGVVMGGEPIPEWQLFEGRRRLRGQLIGLDADTVVLEEEEERFEFPLSLVAKATLDPEL